MLSSHHGLGWACQLEVLSELHVVWLRACAPQLVFSIIYQVNNVLQEALLPVLAAGKKEKSGPTPTKKIFNRGSKLVPVLGGVPLPTLLE